MIRISNSNFCPIHFLAVKYIVVTKCFRICKTPYYLQWLGYLALFFVLSSRWRYSPVLIKCTVHRDQKFTGWTSHLKVNLLLQNDAYCNNFAAKSLVIPKGGPLGVHIIWAWLVRITQGVPRFAKLTLCWQTYCCMPNKLGDQK